MADATTLTVCFFGERQTIDAETTSAPGLVVHRSPFDDGWRLTHHTGLTFGEFDLSEQAHAAAERLSGETDWTRGANAIRAEGDRLIRAAVLAVWAEDGDFLYKPGGVGERILRELDAEQAAS